MKYLVHMTYNEKQIITAEQRDLLVKVLTKTKSQFVEINDVYVQTKDIRLIRPLKGRRTYKPAHEMEGVADLIKERRVLLKGQERKRLEHKKS